MDVSVRNNQTTFHAFVKARELEHCDNLLAIFQRLAWQELRSYVSGGSKTVRGCESHDYRYYSAVYAI